MIPSARTSAAVADAEVQKRKVDATEHVPKPPKAPRRTRTMALQLGLESGVLPVPTIAGDTTGNTEDDDVVPPLAFGVGDAFQLALNAAALQTLSLKHGGSAPVRVYRGQLLPPRESGNLLDGSRSSDVSHIADTHGHGGHRARSTRHSSSAASEPGNRRTRSRAPITDPLISPRAPSELPSPRTLVMPELPSSHPASRAEVVATADQLRQSLLALSDTAEVREEFELWKSAFGEVVRQVSVHCYERGQLLEAIRSRTGEITEKLVKFQESVLQGERTPVVTEAVAADVKDEGDARRGIAQAIALRFTRAAASGQRAQLEADMFNEKRREESLRFDHDQLRAQYGLLGEQLEAAKRRIAELESENERPSLDDVYEQACKLPPDDQVDLEVRLLVRPPSIRSPPLLSTLDLTRQSNLMLTLLEPLEEHQRLAILAAIAPPALPKLLPHLAQSLLTSSSMSPRDAGVVLAAALRSAHHDEDSLAGNATQPRSSGEYTAIAQAVFDELGDLTRSAPEALAVMKARLGAVLMAPPAAGGGDELDVLRAIINQRDVTIDTLTAQLEHARREAAESAERLLKANAQVKYKRNQVQDGLDKQAEAVEAAASPAASGGETGTGTGAPSAKSAGVQLTGTLMRKYKEELRHANMRIDELEAMLAESQDRMAAQVKALQGQLASRDMAARNGSGSTAEVLIMEDSGRRSPRPPPTPRLSRGGTATLLSRGNSRAKSTYVVDDRLKTPLLGNLSPPKTPRDQPLDLALADRNLSGRFSPQETHLEGDEAGATGAGPRRLSRENEGSSRLSLGGVDKRRSIGGGGGGGDGGVARGGTAGSGGSGASYGGGGIAGGDKRRSGVGINGGERRRSGAGVAAGGGGGRLGTAGSGGDDNAASGPNFNHTHHHAPGKLNFGALTLDMSKSKPMSITFLFRITAQMLSTKLVADEKAQLAGKMPLSMTDYVSLQMVSVYGAGAMAVRYLQEMVVGLLKYRPDHPRLGLFCTTLNLVEDESELCEAPPIIAFTHELIRTLLQFMEREKMTTGVTSVAFFQNYSNINAMFVPIEYVAAAIQHITETDEPLRDSLFQFLKDFSDRALHADEKTCVAVCKSQASSRPLRRKACVVSPKSEGGFVDLDQLLKEITIAYKEVFDRRVGTVFKAFVKYDEDGDGDLSKAEFRALVLDLSRGTLKPTQMDNMYESLKAIGDGKIKPYELHQMLYVMTSKQKAELMAPSKLDITDDDIDHEAQIAKLAYDWESVRNAMSVEPDVERMTHFKMPSTLGMIIKVQSAFRGLLTRTKQQAIAEEPAAAAEAAAAASVSWERDSSSPKPMPPKPRPLMGAATSYNLLNPQVSSPNGRTASYLPTANVACQAMLLRVQRCRYCHRVQYEDDDAAVVIQAAARRRRAKAAVRARRNDQQQQHTEQHGNNAQLQMPSTVDNKPQLKMSSTATVVNIQL